MARVGRNRSAWRLCAGERPACPRAPSPRPCNPSGSSTSSCTPSIERAFWQGICDAVRRGASIRIYNDDIVIASLMNRGFSLVDARGYVHYGCCNPHLPGWEPQLREYQHSLVKCLELALNNGRDPYPTKPTRLENELRDHSPAYSVDEVYAGPRTGDAEDLRTFADLCGFPRGDQEGGLRGRLAFTWRIA